VNKAVPLLRSLLRIFEKSNTLYSVNRMLWEANECAFGNWYRT
jgi:hypothetical protein